MGGGVATFADDFVRRLREAGVDEVLEAVSEPTALSRASSVSDAVLKGTGDFEGDSVAGRPPSTSNFREGVETFEIGNGGDD
jgi:hypothetical protein